MIKVTAATPRFCLLLNIVATGMRGDNLVLPKRSARKSLLPPMFSLLLSFAPKESSL